MSVTTDIVCTSCKEKLWVGQRDYIYLAEEKIKKLNDFLQKHRTNISGPEHNLLFVDEHWDEMYEPSWKIYE